MALPEPKHWELTTGIYVGFTSVRTDNLIPGTDY
eukprot:CAMPEP_0194385418 /NCGR_PEP_ID=MMETSP0174-20130528/80281_1 /TAXON_ID=216777 /ORGANISM="Proboscia alata, Strain PI-D3" /LENGTH=33 /DNA_ID= /DNA_START= /DNA_END= /DNA_ORIENTATION=